MFASPNSNNSSVGEDPLEDLGQIQQQLDQLSTIGRCEYERTCTLLIQLFDENAQVRVLVYVCVGACVRACMD